MVNEKNKLIKELIIDVIFTLGLIGLTIIGVLYVFPEVNNAKVETIEEFECENAINCSCKKISVDVIIVKMIIVKKLIVKKSYKIAYFFDN